MAIMEMRVWKYAVAFGHAMTVPGKPIHFGTQRGAPFVWCEVDDDAAQQTIVWLVPTGREIPRDYRHFMTTQSGDYVWHLYVRDDGA